MAAISAAERGADVVVLEHTDKAASKLRITGNGKCNFTNIYLGTDCYYNVNSKRLIGFFERFNNYSAIDFFKKLGVDSVIKDGYVYPESADAVQLAEALINRCEELGVMIRYDCYDIDIRELLAVSDLLIIATGGRSYKKTGSDGSGYKLLEKLGIKYSRVLPALCPLNCDDSFLIEHKGERVLAKVSAVIEDETVASFSGEVQILEKYLSGIPVFQLSRYITRAIDESKKAEVIINFDPSEEELPPFLKQRKAAPEYGIRRFCIDKQSSFSKAQICTGGVSMDQLDNNLRLKELPSVALCGEIIDVDGICGGYNLQWAWTSGYIAGGSVCSE